MRKFPNLPRSSATSDNDDLALVSSVGGIAKAVLEMNLEPVQCADIPKQ